MAQIDKQDRKDIIKEAMVEVYRNTDANIGKSRVSQCQPGDHAWRKLTDTEIVCTKCPTIHIIGEDNVNEMFPN